MTGRAEVAALDAAHHCVTCSDEGCEMEVLRVDAGRELALCAEGDGRRRSVEIALVGEVAAGDVLLVHAGTALTRVRRAEEPA